jgi:hypothetical protein
MKKMKFIIGLAMLSCSIFVNAETIPDPTVQIATPPVGLPGANNNSIHVPLIEMSGGLKIQGVFIMEDTKEKKYSKVFISGGQYKVNDVVDDTWKVKSIERKKVVLVNLETKEKKVFNISGE